MSFYFLTLFPAFWFAMLNMKLAMSESRAWSSEERSSLKELNILHCDWRSDCLSPVFWLSLCLWVSRRDSREFVVVLIWVWRSCKWSLSKTVNQQSVSQLVNIFILINHLNEPLTLSNIFSGQLLQIFSLYQFSQSMTSHDSPDSPLGVSAGAPC